MFYGKGITKANAQSIPGIKRLQAENPDITIVAGYQAYCRAKITKKVIILNTALNKKLLISIALHELGHIRTHNENLFIISREKLAWKFARKYAKDHNYQYNDEEEKESLAVYLDGYKESRKFLRERNRLMPTPIKITEELFQEYYTMCLRRSFSY